ncbi:MAG: SCO family protein [Sphingomicrobium sp.]
MRRLQITLWILAGIAAIAGLVLALNPPAPGSKAPPRRGLPIASIGGPFTLTGSDGQPFASSRLNGQPAAIFFGFTHCPDVCPTTLARLAKLRRQLGKGNDGFAIVFITVDPERDKPADVGKYAALFDTPVIGLTGSPAEIERVKQQFGVYSERAPQAGGDYSVNHTVSVFLLGGDGRFVATIAPEESDQAALDKLKRIAG